MGAIDECGAPVVSIAGGEPLLHREMPKIVKGFLARKKLVILCTNALLLAKKIDHYQPHPSFTWSIHLDGNRAMHDKSVRSEEHTSELQSLAYLVCRLLLEKKKNNTKK